jgi:hypothetical protein
MKKKAGAGPYRPIFPSRYLKVAGDSGAIEVSLIYEWDRKAIAEIDDPGQGSFGQHLLAKTLMEASPMFQRVALVLFAGRVPMLIAGDNHGRWWDVSGKSITVTEGAPA